MMYVVLLAMISTSLAAPQASTCPNGELIHCPHPGTAGQPARPTTRHCVPNRTCPTGQVPCVPPPPTSLLPQTSFEHFIISSKVYVKTKQVQCGTLWTGR